MMNEGDKILVGPASGGALLKVRVRPRASRRGVDGVREGALELRVTAPPVEGEANAAARDLLAEFLGVARSRISLSAGGKSRRKTFLVEGLPPDELRRRLEAALTRIIHERAEEASK